MQTTACAAKHLTGYGCLPLLRTDRYTYSNKGGQQHT
jgi:hypothetical protein